MHGVLQEYYASSTVLHLSGNSSTSASAHIHVPGTWARECILQAIKHCADSLFGVCGNLISAAELLAIEFASRIRVGFLFLFVSRCRCAKSGVGVCTETMFRCPLDVNQHSEEIGSTASSDSCDADTAMDTAAGRVIETSCRFVAAGPAKPLRSEWQS